VRWVASGPLEPRYRKPPTELTDQARVVHRPPPLWTTRLRRPEMSVRTSTLEIGGRRPSPARSGSGSAFERDGTVRAFRSRRQGRRRFRKASGQGGVRGGGMCACGQPRPRRPDLSVLAATLEIGGRRPARGPRGLVPGGSGQGGRCWSGAWADVGCVRVCGQPSPWPPDMSVPARRLEIGGRRPAAHRRFGSLWRSCPVPAAGCDQGLGKPSGPGRRSGLASEV